MATILIAYVSTVHLEAGPPPTKLAATQRYQPSEDIGLSGMQALLMRLDAGIRII